MKLKKYKGTLRHSFDVARVQRLLNQNALDEDDAKRILGEALHVIAGLRLDFRSLRRGATALHHTAEWLGKSVWVGPNA